ncbi:response regulator [Agarilytica rhodophyticola]|uniref:response regulator n=1 Tax=Agarilytica rhodophyticola TaxID=1737490 RepID=UPI000B34733D|nr:response regulator [Agarilytica rhodophyticola]
MNNKKIVVVEDEEKIAQILVDYLEPEGFEVKVVNNGSDALDTIQNYSPDFVILDVMLPGKDGLSICKELRKFSNVPVLMLTARSDEIDRLLGLELGADDYVCKPFLPREIVARIKAILRRANETSTTKQEHIIGYRSIRLLPDRFQCQAGQQTIELTPVEFRMLQALISEPKKVFSREKLMQASYLDDRIVSGRTIDSHVKNLRQKLADAIGNEEIIHSIYGVGYKVE